jgi:O-antigen/teichoic acid export membrane protein
MLGVIYAPDYVLHGAPALRALALGNVAFSIFAIAGTILNGAGRTLPAVVTAAVTLVLATAGNAIAIPIAAERGEVLRVAALVTTGAMAIGAIISGVVLRRELGAFMPLASIARIAIATGVALALGRALPGVLPAGKLMTLVGAAVVAATFLIVLIVTRELGKRDLAAISALRAARRKRPPTEP